MTWNVNMITPRSLNITMNTIITIMNITHTKIIATNTITITIINMIHQDHYDHHQHRPHQHHQQRPRRRSINTIINIVASITMTNITDAKIINIIINGTNKTVIIK